MKISTLNEWLNESNNEGFLEPTDENLEKFGLHPSLAAINSEGSIDYEGDVNLSGKDLKYIPFKFNKVAGSFDISNNYLFSLTGSPREVEKDFNCWNNQLINLKGGPDVVKRNFNCQYNLLISLAGMPSKIWDKFNYTCNVIIYNPTKYGSAFNLYDKWMMKESEGKWTNHTGEEYLKMAFERLNELSKEEILGIIDNIDKVEMPDDLRAHCEKKLFKYKVKFRPENKFQKILSGIEDDVVDMF